MKYITFVVPSYNSEDYLEKCVDSLLSGGEDVEIIIVNDGSTDRTAEIADRYEKEYPGIVHALHKPNGGYGSGVNAGLESASGVYFKVVDSDDWLDGEAYGEVLRTLKRHTDSGEGADLYITNFVYEHLCDDTRYISDYTTKFPQNRFFGWNEIKPLRLWKMILMHSLIYRTEKLKETGLVMPEHCFYVDNYYAYYPFPYMERLYYVNVDLYRYYIGRSDQSVALENMTKRYSDQITCMTRMLLSYTYAELKAMCRGLRKLMYHILHVILLNTYFFTTAADDEERRRKLAGMWNSLKQKDKKLYRRIRRMPAIAFLNSLSWRLKGKFTLASYKYLCKHVKLGHL